MILVLVVLAALLRLLPALRPLLFVDDLAIPDDAYLSLTIARNFAHGLGPWYGLAPTNGFQPLYVFLMAPVFALFPHSLEAPVRAALLLLVACDTLTLVVLARFVSRLTAHRWVPRVIALSWALNPYAILTSLNALETSLSALLALVAFDCFDRQRSVYPGAPPSFRDGAVLGAWVGFAALARIDNLLLLAAFGLPLWFGPGTVASRGRALLALAGAALLVQLPWLLTSWHSTGLWFPVSGRAVRYQCLSNVHHAPTWSNFYGPLALRAALVVVRRNLVPIALVLGLALGLPFLRGAKAPDTPKDRLRRLAPMMLFGALLLLAYVGVIFGPWYFPRYFFPLALPLAAGAGVLLDEWLARLRTPVVRKGLIACVALLIAAGSVLQPGFRRLYAPGPSRPWGYMRIGLWARAHVPAGSVIGGSQTGALGYFADRVTVVNLDGVVNQAAFDALRGKRAIDYVRAAGIRTLVWQDDIEFIARESRNYRQGDITPVETLREFQTVGEPWHVYRVAPRGAGAPRR